MRLTPMTAVSVLAMALFSVGCGSEKPDSDADKANTDGSTPHAESDKPDASGEKSNGEYADAAGPPSEQVKSMFGGVKAEIISAKNPITPAKVELGRMLYYDDRISANGTISCNSCHKLDNYGVDSLPTSPGHDGTLGGRNSPTVYNAAAHVAQFWDGREADVEAQAKGPVLNPVEHGLEDGAQVEEIIKSIPGYAPLFAEAFPGEEDPITFDNFARAIGAFERKLVTKGRWDSWLAGEGAALTGQEKAGLDLFIETGCVTCHMGPYFGGSIYQKLGAIEPFHTADMGRFAVTQNEAEMNFFKVPGLRNVAETGPYLHDGSVGSLEEMVTIMAKHQLGKELTTAQVTDMVAFLKSLTGKIPDEYIKRPMLPEDEG
ncbi:MAG: c-type cytochrome [Phycisphaerales bacterium]|nr:c-type cytochrome [Phycisphaerales bacterium]